MPNMIHLDFERIGGFDDILMILTMEGLTDHSISAQPCQELVCVESVSADRVVSVL
ncbi:hypothetical protein Glove_168g217 [Diversispora epigaea]|uniref:Uncharacterized protein n=1 Tax=Diversispora epigaea TaxID=1348612 RepID=A0A397ISP8_9GLOM|nr:hypothetical protein Glove_168g217 [Diversispora epigaea]